MLVPMKKLPAGAITYALCIVAALFYSFFIANSLFLEASRLTLLDRMFQLRSDYSKEQSSISDLVVVGLDDESLRNINRTWPWGREVFAVFVENLQAMEPRTIGIDFAFVGKSADAEADEWLATAIGMRNNVVVAAYFDPKQTYVAPIEPIQKSARAHGFLEKTLDADEGTRTAQASVVDGDNVRFSFAAWCASLFDGASVAERAERFHHQSYRISFRHPAKDFTYVPFWQVMARQVDPDLLRDKLVIVGAVSSIFHDFHHTPLDFMPGVFVNANDILMFLDDDFVNEPAPPVYWGIFAILVVVISLIFQKTTFVHRFFIFIGAEALIFLAGLILFIRTGWLVDPFHYMLILVILYVTVFFVKGLLTFWENSALQRMVIMDALTGLYGYRYLLFRLDAEFEKAKRTRKRFYAVMLDVDFFKKVNDTYGHEQGNQVLVAVAKTLKNGVRTYDVAGRYGGEEFMLILFHHDEKDVLQTVERIRANVEQQEYTVQGGTFHVTLSAGICSNRHPEVKTKDDLIRKADEALYRAKERGRNRIEFAAAQKR